MKVFFSTFSGYLIGCVLFGLLLAYIGDYFIDLVVGKFSEKHSIIVSHNSVSGVRG